MADTDRTLFREKAMSRVSSPEDLTSCLRVTTPGVWVVLAAVIALLAGLFAWSAAGTLDTTVDAVAVVKDQTAVIVLSGRGAEDLKAGMPLRIGSREFAIASVDRDEYGRTTAAAEVSLPDGSYDAKIVTARTRPVEFLLESR